jgi:hypothetical protein
VVADFGQQSVMTALGRFIKGKTMSDNDTLLLQRAEQLRAHLATLLDNLYRQQPSLSEAAVDPMQSLMQGPAKDSFFGILKLVTFGLVQKLVPNMPQDAIDPALLDLAHARISVPSANTTVFRLKPGKLTARWIDEKGQLKVDDMQFKPSWLWLLLNFRTALDLRRKFASAMPSAPAPLNG